MSWARIVPVVALVWKVEARVPAARVRLNAMAQTSQALLARKCRQMRQRPVLEVGDDLLDDRVRAVRLLGFEHGQTDLDLVLRSNASRTWC